MFILIEARELVVAAFAAQLAREGVAVKGFRPREFHEWLSGATKHELNAIEGFLVGDAPTDAVASIKELRSRCAGPVIALLENSYLERTLDLFASGADDVVRKPVQARELLARVRAIRRRSEAQSGHASIGPMRVFFDGRDPEIGGDPLALPRRERRILEFLAAHRGRRVTKSQIFNCIYGLFDEDVEENVVESHVSKLRKKLRERIGYDPIDSKRYLGYCLVESAKGDIDGARFAPARHEADGARARPLAYA
jgi:two-component system, OmpR family, flagellar system response regulator FtcR